MTGGLLLHDVVTDSSYKVKDRDGTPTGDSTDWPLSFILHV